MVTHSEAMDADSASAYSLSTSRDTPASSTDLAAQAQILEPPRVSRYAKLGLNAHPIKISDQKKRFSGRVTNKSSRAAEKQVHPRQILEEESDMDDLEAMLFPGVPQQNDGALTTDTLSNEPTPNYQDHSEAIVTNLGWRPMHNPEARVVRGPILQQADVPKSHNTWTSINGRHPVDLNLNLTNALEDDDEPWIDEKYFDLENYLEHATGIRYEKRVAKEARNTPDTPRSSKTARKSTSRSLALKQHHLDIEDTIEGDQALRAAPAEASPRSKLQASHASQPRSSLSVEDAATIPDEEIITTETSSPGPALGPSNEWELMEENSDPLALDESTAPKFTIRLHRIGTNEIKTHTFDKLSHYFIDSLDKRHVQLINKWRYDTLRRYGVESKQVRSYFRPEEKAWLMLFHKKVKVAVEAGYNVKMPGAAPTLEAFNKFFVGKIFQDANGDDTMPREPRDHCSLSSKLHHGNSGFQGIRLVIRKLSEGKKYGILYVPVITEEEFEKFQLNGTVLSDDPTDGEKNVALVDGMERKRSSPKHKRA